MSLSTLYDDGRILARIVLLAECKICKNTDPAARSRTWAGGGLSALDRLVRVASFEILDELVVRAVREAVGQRARQVLEESRVRTVSREEGVLGGAPGDAQGREPVADLVALLHERLVQVVGIEPGLAHLADFSGEVCESLFASLELRVTLGAVGCAGSETVAVDPQVRHLHGVVPVHDDDVSAEVPGPVADSPGLDDLGVELRDLLALLVDVTVAESLDRTFFGRGLQIRAHRAGQGGRGSEQCGQDDGDHGVSGVLGVVGRPHCSTADTTLYKKGSSKSI